MDKRYHPVCIEYSATPDGSVYGIFGKKLTPKLKDKKKKYLRITLQENKKPISYPLHRFIAETFLPNPDNLQEINHIDGNPANNRVDNLEWCSRQHNMKHASTIGALDWTEPRRTKFKIAMETRYSECRHWKISNQDIDEIKAAMQGLKQYTWGYGKKIKELANKYGVSEPVIRKLFPKYGKGIKNPAI